MGHLGAHPFGCFVHFDSMSLLCHLAIVAVWISDRSLEVLHDSCLFVLLSFLCVQSIVSIDDFYLHMNFRIASGFCSHVRDFRRFLFASDRNDATIATACANRGLNAKTYWNKVRNVTLDVSFLPLTQTMYVLFMCDSFTLVP